VYVCHSAALTAKEACKIISQDCERFVKVFLYLLVVVQ